MQEGASAGDAAREKAGRAALVLGVVFFFVYLGLGLTFHLRTPRLFGRLDLVFDADVPSRIIDLTRVGGAHYRTQLHPLFVLLLNPLGLAIRAALRAFGVGAPARVAALVLTSAAGAVSVALFFALLRRWLGPGLLALLWAAVFGLSSSQLVFGSLPETFVFSGLGLLAVGLVAADPARSAAARLAAAVACFGMALSNLGAVFLVRAEGVWTRGWRAAVWAGARLSVATLAVTVPLAAVQLWIYPRTVPFYAVTGVARDDHLSIYRPDSLGEGVQRLADVAAHLALFNLAAPRLSVLDAGGEWPTVDFPAASWGALRASGLPHALGWLALLGVASAGLWRGSASLPVPARALLLWLALHAVLHSFFGLSLFLYSCQWTFAVVALLALGLARWAGESASRRRLEVGALLALLALQAWSNAAFLADLLAVFA